MSSTLERIASALENITSLRATATADPLPFPRLRERLAKAERALTRAGWTLLRDPETGDKAQEWRPPLGKRPDFDMIDAARLDGKREAFAQCAEIANGFIEPAALVDGANADLIMVRIQAARAKAMQIRDAIRAAAAADPYKSSNQGEEL